MSGLIQPHSCSSCYCSQKPQKACSACGWSYELQSRCNYPSHIKLFYGASDRGVWALGSKYILKERSTTPPNNEVANVRFLRERTTIPILKIVVEWSEGDRQFLILEQVEGETLDRSGRRSSNEARRPIRLSCLHENNGNLSVSSILTIFLVLLPEKWSRITFLHGVSM